MTRTELRKLFLRERARFARYVGWVGRTKLRLVDGRCVSPKHCAYRDLAYVDLDKDEIVLHVRVLEMSKDHILGLLRHELGHLSDIDVENAGSERRADALAESITGMPIRYDSRDVQTVGRGRSPRPKYLPR